MSLMRPALLSFKYFRQARATYAGFFGKNRFWIPFKNFYRMNSKSFGKT